MAKLHSLPRLIFALFSFISAGSAEAQGNSAVCSKMPYEHNNMVDYGPLKINRIKGNVEDVGGHVVSTGCVGVFSANAKELVASAEIASDGSFEIPGVKGGDYNLVVSLNGFCAANARIRLGRGFRTKGSLIAKMKPRGVDSCSWIETK